MTAITDSWKPASPALTRMVIGLIRTAVLAAGRLAQAYRNRTQAAVLAGMDDRMLADIGLTRSDVRDAFAAPLWDDPTFLLRSRALERRLTRNRHSLGVEEAWFAAPPLAPTEGAKYPPTNRPARYTV